MSKLQASVPADEVGRFCRKWGVLKLFVFGSALRADFGPESDIDLLVELDPSKKIGMYEWVQMIDELRAIFGRDVDLVEKDAIRNPFRLRAILEDTLLIHAA
jgi:hypothetical protein